MNIIVELYLVQSNFSTQLHSESCPEIQLQAGGLEHKSQRLSLRIPRSRLIYEIVEPRHHAPRNKNRNRWKLFKTVGCKWDSYEDITFVPSMPWWKSLIMIHKIVAWGYCAWEVIYICKAASGAELAERSFGHGVNSTARPALAEV